MDKNKREFKFDKRASSYDDGFEGKFSKKFYRVLLSRLNLKPFAKVLDVGCGTGYLLRKMADAQEIQGYGIDITQNMIDIAAEKCSDMTIQTSACEKTPFDEGSFDILTVCMAYHHFSDKAGFAKEAARILKIGGCLYIADPRFPFPVRKTINGVLRLFKVTGRFFTPQEVADDFCRVGFELVDVTCDGIVQVVTLRKLLI